jgi:chitobiase/beta-hexosaminidase-like protein
MNSIGSATPLNIRDAETTQNVDIFMENASFTGATGTGFGLLSARPATCTAGSGGTYHASPTGSYGVAYWATDANSGNGELYVCTATNTWTGIYQPYTYPHPLVSGGSPSVANPVFSPSSGVPSLSVTITDSTGGVTICYRTDGGTPTASVAGVCDSPAITYSGAVSITVNPTTLKAIGTLSGDTNSGVTSSTYGGAAPGGTQIGPGVSVGPGVQITLLELRKFSSLSDLKMRHR